MEKRLVNEASKFLKNFLDGHGGSPVTSTLGDGCGALRQEDPYEFKVNLGYIGSLKPS